MCRFPELQVASMHAGHGLAPGSDSRTQAMLCRLEGGAFKIVWQHAAPASMCALAALHLLVCLQVTCAYVHSACGT